MSSASRSIYHVFVFGQILDAVHPDYLRPHTIPASAKYIPPASIYTLMTFEPHSQRHVVRRPPHRSRQDIVAAETQEALRLSMRLRDTSVKARGDTASAVYAGADGRRARRTNTPNVSASGTARWRGNGVGTATLQAKHCAITSPRFVTSFRLERGLGPPILAIRDFTMPTPNHKRSTSPKHAACKTSSLMKTATLSLEGWCAGEDSAIARLDDVKTRMADCTGILDTEVDELTQDLNGCIMPWVRSRLIPPRSSSPFAPPSLPYSSNPSRPMSVGIHIRWGDTAPLRGTDISTHDFYGSMNFPDIARILADLRAFSSNPLEITIAMEEADRAVIALLNLEAGGVYIVGFAADTGAG
ncbi:hypothetical protein R3P38DRAFT_3593864 [Favolaschia claudopus]|uniref:Uncharacterized protein n=1 Tax=Favolaschia claudopus TaxID=2862362 RepID=A0AAW0DKE1_9AGAR